MEDFLEGFEEVNKGPQIVANESTKARNNERVDIRYSKNIATVTSAAKVYPFYLSEPRREQFFYMFERAFKHVCTAFAVAVTVEPLNM